MTKQSDVLHLAEQEAPRAETWADFSNFLFAPMDGVVTQAYPTRVEREAFVQTPEYQRICSLLQEVRERTGLVAGATPMKTGRCFVRLPSSLHSALTAEAQREGVSLDQLVIAKLAVQLRDAVRSPNAPLEKQSA